MNCHSNQAVENLRKTLLTLEIELLNCDTNIAFYTERYRLFSQSTKQKEIQECLEAKVYVDNYKFYKKRIVKLYNIVIDKINSISARYEGKFDKVFSLYFFQRKSFEEVAEVLKNDFSKKQLKKIIARLEKDLSSF